MVKNKRDTGLLPEWGRPSGEGHGNPLQYSCLENSIGRAAWQATDHGVAKELDTTERLSTQMQISTPDPSRCVTAKTWHAHTHSGIMAWRIPWSEVLGRLHSMGSQGFTALLASVLRGPTAAIAVSLHCLPVYPTVLPGVF